MNRIIESKTYYWINMSLLHKHPVIEYKIEISEWKNNNWIIEFKWTRTEFFYILAGISWLVHRISKYFYCIDNNSKKKKKSWRVFFFTTLFDFRVCFRRHTIRTSMPLRCMEGVVIVMQKFGDFCSDFFNWMNALFVCYDKVSKMKWGISGKLHIGLGKSFLGSLTWSKRANVSEQAR